MENCYDRLDYVEKIINSNGGFSYIKLDEMNKNNKLKTLLEENEIDKLFKEELIRFIGILEDKNLDYHPYLRRLMLHESEYIKIFINKTYNRMLSLYLDSEKSYRNLIIFFRDCVQHYDIEKYKELSLEDIDEILFNNMDLRAWYDLNSQKNLIEVDTRVAELYTNYSNYDYKLSTNSINVLDKTEFFIWSEWYTYINELAQLSKFGMDNYAKWVSRYDGDGYGYDVLSYDLENKREKLIEVKSGQSSNITLTDTEYNVLKQMENKQHCDYYIYKYYYTASDNTIYGIILKYDRYSGLFINIKNPDEKYEIETCEYTDNGGFKRKGAYIKPIENNKKLRKI